jgi:uncharacterized protein YciI
LTIEFEQLSVVLLTTSKGVPERDQREDDAIQDAHMAHLADLHEEGHLVAAGPLSHGHYRGMLLLRTDGPTSEQLMLADPAVRAGWFDVTVIPWMVPGGAMQFASTAFPRSMAEID